MYNIVVVGLLQCLGFHLDLLKKRGKYKEKISKTYITH